MTKVDVGCQVSGLIQSLAVDFNSIVTKGQVLARLDPETFNDALENAQAALGTSEGNENGAEVALEDAQQKLTRAQALAAQQLLDAADLDSAKIVAADAAAAVKSAQADVVRAKFNVSQAQANLDHTIITAPADGVIVNRAVDVGQTVAASSQVPVLYTIASNLETMQVQADVDQSDIASVKEGQTATFEVEAYPNETFTGTITQVRLQSGSATSSAAATPSATGGAGTATAGVTFLTVITVANPERRLRPGMTATVFLTGLERGDVLRIPNQALLFRPSLDLLKAIGETPPADPRSGSSSDEPLAEVWTYDGTRFTPVAVTIGLSDAQWAEQTQGSLKPGDKLVINTSFKK